MRGLPGAHIGRPFHPVWSLPAPRQSTPGDARHRRGWPSAGRRYDDGLTARRPDVSRFPGRYVALDLDTDEVLADAATLPALAAIIRTRGLPGSIVRAPRDDEPVVVGLG